MTESTSAWLAPLSSCAISPSLMKRTRSAIAAARAFVRDHHGRLPVGFGRVAQELEDLAARLRVEVSGRLVGEEDRRAGHEGARDGDALLLAA